MSRVGKLAVQIPPKVVVAVTDDVVRVEGPKGVLQHRVPAGIQVDITDGTLRVRRRDDSRRQRALHGLTRRLLSNMIQGVAVGFSRTLDIVGVGYRAEARGEALHLSLGYSHPILFQLPPGVQARVEKQTSITLESIDRQLLGETAATIRRLRPPEPYKGKGIRYTGEVLRRKAGKAGGAAGGS